MGAYGLKVAKQEIYNNICTKSDMSHKKSKNIPEIVKKCVQFPVSSLNRSKWRKHVDANSTRRPGLDVSD